VAGRRCRFRRELAGCAFLILVGLGIAGRGEVPVLRSPRGKVLYGVLAALIAAAIARSLVRAYWRQRELRAMLADAKPVQGRAAEIAREVGILLFEVQDDRQMLIMVANAPHAVRIFRRCHCVNSKMSSCAPRSFTSAPISNVAITASRPGSTFD